MDPDSVAFWGITLKPGDPTDLELQLGEALHVTMASYGPSLKDSNGRSVVTVKVGESEKSFAVCALTAGKNESSVLDIQFAGEEKVTFTLSGKNEVHLVGNFHFEDSDDSDDMEGDEDLIDVYDDGAMGEQSDDSDDVEAPTLMIENDPPVITEVKEDEEEEEKQQEKKQQEKKPVKSKKGKNAKVDAKANGKTPEKQNGKTPDKPSAKKAQQGANKEEQKSQVKQTGNSKKTAKVEDKTADAKSTPVKRTPGQAGKRKNDDAKDSVTPSKKPKNEKKVDVEKTPEPVVDSKEEDLTASAQKSEKKRKRKKKGKGKSQPATQSS